MANITWGWNFDKPEQERTRIIVYDLTQLAENSLPTLEALSQLVMYYLILSFLV